MKMRNYLKEMKERGINSDWKLVCRAVADKLCSNKTIISRSLGIGILLLILSVVFVNKNINEADMDNIDLLKFSETPIAASAAQKSVITIPSGIVKANPFVPYRDLTDTGVVNDVPQYNIVEPPEEINSNSDAARVMDTIVSGILYDKFSPSAIINIEGNDYLVKKGDVVNNYKVLAISQDSVTVQLGSNTYKAGIGEILTEGNMNHNEVSNLSNKFGGEK